MKVSLVGEFGLIDKLSLIVRNDKTGSTNLARRGLLVGIGDDACVWKTHNSFQMATVDSLVQDVHFSLEYMTWEELGWKALAVNISDIATMGGIPVYALVSLGLPAETEEEDVISLYRGMNEIARQYGVEIAGGDTVNSPFVFISVTVFGTTSDKKMQCSSVLKPCRETKLLLLATLELQLLAIEFYRKIFPAI